MDDNAVLTMCFIAAVYMVLSVSSLNVNPSRPYGYRPVAGDVRRRCRVEIGQRQ